MGRRKQYVPKIVEDLVKEHTWNSQVYRLGQKVYCQRHGDGKLCLGSIDRIYPEGEESHFSFIDEATGQHRVAYFRDIIPNPTRKNINSVNADIAKNAQSIKDLKK